MGSPVSKQYPKDLSFIRRNDLSILGSSFRSLSKFEEKAWILLHTAPDQLHRLSQEVGLTMPSSLQYEPMVCCFKSLSNA